jgi:hypothetical protein
MNRLIGALVLALAATTSATAKEVRAVVELFTSQGCSSCPPADAMLLDMTARRDVIALTMPVDYWDYLGWRDTLARPAFTARQKGYSKTRGDRQVYTPQMIVNGAIACVGSDKDAVEKAVSKAAPLSVSITMRESGETLFVTVSGAGDGAEVLLLPVASTRVVSIGRGENSGRSVTYGNVVQSISRVGAWPGGSASFEMPLALAKAEGADFYVVLVQRMRKGRPAEIVGAVRSGS